MDWWKQVWKSEGNFKAKITLWLALSNTFLTWENLKKRGWHGPNWCVLNATKMRKLDLICFLYVLMQKQCGSLQRAKI